MAVCYQLAYQKKTFSKSIRLAELRSVAIPFLLKNSELSTGVEYGIFTVIRRKDIAVTETQHFFRPKKAHQVPDLMVPSGRYEYYLASFLYYLETPQRRRVVVRILFTVVQLLGGGVEGQLAVSVAKTVLLAGRKEEPSLPANDIGRPAVRRQNIRVERCPANRRALRTCAK